jgi:citrate lyase beta subunit
MSDIGDSVNSMRSLDTARSLLFVPGSDDRKLAKALDAGADAVVADLEDAVLPDEKVRARARVAEALTSAGRSLRLVRVNAFGTTWFEDDVSSVAAAGVDGIVLPKASPEAAQEAATLGIPVVAIVETADGLRRAHAIASAPGVVALLLGAIDLGLALGLEPREDAHEVLFARSTLVVDSAAAGRRSPIDRVWIDVRDLDGLERDCALARSLGFRGKACIHPEQVAVVDEAFASSADELERARAVVAAYERATADGEGVVALDGSMIDLPVVESARRLLADEKRSMLHAE